MTDDFDVKKLEKEMDEWAKKQYKGKLVNLYNEKPIQFDVKSVRNMRDKLNSGKEVNKKTLVKMLNQLQYMIPEYRSLVFGMNCISVKAKKYADSHTRVAYPDPKKV